MWTEPCRVLTSLREPEGEGEGRCCHNTHAAPWSWLSLWGHGWGQLWTRKLGLDIQISAVLLRVHPRLLPVPRSPAPSAVKVVSYLCLQLKDLVGTLHRVGHQENKH